MKALKKIAVIAVLTMTLGMLLSPAVLAETTGTVSCTVTPTLISVAVDPTGYDYGILGNSAVADSSAITATNNGNVSETLQLQGSDAMIGATTAWTLSDTAIGADQFMHEFAKADESYGTYYALSSSAYSPLATGVGASTSKDFKLKIHTPSSTTASGTLTTAVTVLASE